jgi:N-acetylmuramoyl-L-alanine amidase
MIRRSTWAAAVFSILPGIAAANSGLITVTNIRSWSHADSTRVIIETTGPFVYLQDRAVNPDRLFFDLPSARPLVDGKRYVTHVVGDRLVERVRIAETMPGTTRIVFDLTGPHEFTVERLEAPDRMVIEIHSKTKAPAPVSTPPPVITKATPSVSRAAASRRSHVPFVYPPRIEPHYALPVLAGMPPQFDVRPLTVPFLWDPGAVIAAARPPRQKLTLTASAPKPAEYVPPSALAIDPPSQPATSTTKVLPAMRPAPADMAKAHPPANAAQSMTRALGLKVSRVVIDAGHGGHDEGTVGPDGVREKDVVLDVALRLSKLVQSRMGAEVILTRSDDTFVPLRERTAIANEHQADLFLSIHANSSPAPAVAGIETFYLNFTSSPGAIDVAARENALSDRGVGELKDLIQSITLNDKITESQTFAQTIQKTLSAQAGKSNVAAKDRGVKRAPFVVLIGAGMPSILAEIGFLSNNKDESNLNTPDYRQKIAEALYKGLSQYSTSLSHFEVAGFDRDRVAGLN